MVKPSDSLGNTAIVSRLSFPFFSDQAPEADQEILVSATFPEASHVELALEPWNWESKPMEKHEDGWQTRARLPSGNGVLFKFIVDGEWRCSEQYPIVKDNTFENNYIGCM